MSEIKINDFFGIAKGVKLTVGSVLTFASVILWGDCTGCIDTVEVIHAVRGDSTCVEQVKK